MNNRAEIKLENDRLMVSGDLNFLSIINIWSASLPLMESSPKLVFDFAGVTNVNSAGLALLVEWIKLANKMNKKISFMSIPPQLISIGGVCGVAPMLKFVSETVVS